MGFEVLGTPIGTDAYIKDFVAQNCIKIIRDHVTMTGHVKMCETISQGLTSLIKIMRDVSP